MIHRSLQDHLPAGFNHDMIREMFERFGQVNYVSLPRRPDRSFKEFAFIEFDKYEEATAAIAALNLFHPRNNPQGLRVMHKYSTYCSVMMDAVSAKLHSILISHCLGNHGWR